MRFETKIVILVHADLPTWQKLNITAFLASGIAAAAPETIGEAYADASDNQYLAMFRQPVLVFGAGSQELRSAYERAMGRGVACVLFTRELFATGNDTDNRAAVRAVAAADLDLVGLGFHTSRAQADKITKGIGLHT